MLENASRTPGPVHPVFDVAVEASFDFRSAEYARLFETSAATAFQHPLWLHALYERLLQHNGALPLIVTVRRASDRSLAMVLPLVKRRYAALRVVEFADLRVSDYVAAVADEASFAAIVGDQATRRQILSVLRPYDLLRFGKLADGTLPLNRVFGIARPESMGMNAYAVPLSGPYEAWREQRLQPSFRKELDKKRRQLHRKGQVRFEQSTAAADIATTFDALRLYRRDRFEANGGGELLQIPAYFDFYVSIAMRTDFARTYTLRIDDKTIAGALGLAHRGSLLVILGGFTQTEFKNQSVGSLMFQEIARDCIERGETLLDFTIGDEPYKLMFGAEPGPMWQMSRAGSPLGYAAGMLVEKLPSAKALARRLFHRGGLTTGPGTRSPGAAADEALEL
jgi:CelD/BcsL family acetyltransferase involved in cellulose biosynthesis